MCPLQVELLSVTFWPRNGWDPFAYCDPSYKNLAFSNFCRKSLLRSFIVWHKWVWKRVKTSSGKVVVTSLPYLTIHRCRRPHLPKICDQSDLSYENSAFSVIARLPSSHTKANEPKPTKFCQMLGRLRVLLSTVKLLGKFVPKKFAHIICWNFWQLFLRLLHSTQHMSGTKRCIDEPKYFCQSTMCPLKVNLLSVTFGPETVENRWRIVTDPMTSCSAVADKPTQRTTSRQMANF